MRIRPLVYTTRTLCISFTSSLSSFLSNPTGAAATKEQLESIVEICKERGSILVFDAAYAPFIRSKDVPKSIFEIDGAKEVAIEVNSFSKYAGFTGVRLGWTVIPSSLKFKDGTPVKQDFNRVMTTAFNGASNIVQSGGMACLDDEGMKEIDTLIDYYLENAKILRETMESIGYTVYGGTDAPYVFVKLPESMGGSWAAFTTILEKAQVVTIPGAGFGPGGEGFLRLSAFAPRESVVEACARLKKALGKRGKASMNQMIVDGVRILCNSISAVRCRRWAAAECSARLTARPDHHAIVTTMHAPRSTLPSTHSYHPLATPVARALSKC